MLNYFVQNLRWQYVNDILDCIFTWPNYYCLSSKGIIGGAVQAFYSWRVSVLTHNNVIATHSPLFDNFIL